MQHEHSAEVGRPKRSGGRLTWQKATLAAAVTETSTARTLIFDAPDWPATCPGSTWTSG